MDDLRKRTAMAHSGVGVETALCSEAGDDAMMCSRARIEDGKWRQWRDSFLGDRRVRERVRGQKIAKYDERERGARDFRVWDVMSDVPLVRTSPFS
jgi:hypothetical protein